MLVGATLGNRYVVLSVIGRGGMSVVYKAKEISTGLIVAVKTLRTAGLTDEMIVKRFQREAELLSRLNHPRIVNLHAYGTSARGQPYFVMDFLVGDNLVTVLKNDDHLDPERFQDIFVQVCAAIEHAHKHGAIHRDIKPGNIMLTRTKRTKDYVKVVDFGIAKLAEEAQKLTRMGEVWGSPIYMSPEQCMGAAIDARSDIYSLGIVMYECLTGRVPFLGRNYADTMGKQISETPPTFAKMRPDLQIPESLEAIVMMSLEKDPNGRYQSLTQMRKDLESALSAQPSTSITIPPKMSKSPGRLPATGQESMPPRNSGNKLKALGESARRTADQSLPKQEMTSKNRQSRSNLRSQTAPDMERTRKNSATRARLEPAVINPNRVRNLILIAAGSLIFTASVIAVFTNGPLVASIAAAVIKQMVGGLDDGEKQTDPTQGNAPQTGTQTGEDATYKDPQQALQDWLSPGGAVSPSSGTGQDGSQATAGSQGADSAQDQAQIKAEEDQKLQEQRRQAQEQDQQQQDQQRDQQQDQQRLQDQERQ